jgi:hypothetical protein
MPQPLTSFQQQAVEAALRSIQSGKKKILLSVPAGGGKSRIITSLLYQYTRQQGDIYQIKALIVCDRIEVVEQTIRVINEYYDDAVAGHVDSDSGYIPIRVGTAQRVTKSIDPYKFSSSDYHAIVYLNCESLGIGKASADVKKIIDTYYNAIMIGIDHYVEKSILYFGAVDYKISVDDLIKIGVFAPAKYSAVSTSSIIAEFAKPDVIAGSLVKECAGQKTVVYCSSIQQARTFTIALNILKKSEGFSAVITSAMTADERKTIINQYNNDSLPQMLFCINPMLTTLTPKTACIVFLRTVTSELLIEQMLLPGRRMFEGKQFLHVLDYGNNQSLKAHLINAAHVPLNDSNESKDKNKNIAKNGVQRTTISFRADKTINPVFGVEDIAEELAELLAQMRNEPGAMIGIFGRWGRGKTFLIDRTWKILQQTSSTIRVDFHAWRYPDTPASWAYLYENLSDIYAASEVWGAPLRWMHTKWKIFRLNYKRKGWIPILKSLIIILCGIVSWVLLNIVAKQQKEAISNLVKYLGIPITVAATAYQLLIHLKKEYSSKAKDIFTKYASRHSFKEHLGLQAEIQKEIKNLLAVWIPEKKVKKKRIMLFVDDVDRCSEAKIIQVIDALRVMLDDEEISKRLVIVIAVDERILKRAINLKYADLVKVDAAAPKQRESLQLLTTEYMDKLFITGVKLGDLSAQDRDHFFQVFSEGDLYREDAKDIGPAVYRSSDKPEMLAEEEFFDDDLTKVSVTDSTRRTVPHYKLTMEEYEIFRTTLRKHDNLTPRQIKIFYFRYLFAKNLLIRRYRYVTRPNIWLQPENVKTFMELLGSYLHLSESAVLVSQEKVDILHTTAQQLPVPRSANINVDALDLGELMQVLDVVVAY